MFKGTYVFKQLGKEIGRSNNIITNNGKKVILQYLAGTRNNWAADLAIGAIPTTPTANDVELNFETLRVPVNMKTFIYETSTNPNLIVVRGTIPANVYANIYEIGLYADTQVSNVSLRDNRILVEFSDLNNWITNSGVVNVIPYVPQAEFSPRIGGNSVELISNTVYSNSSYSFSLQGYSSIDTLQILAYNTVAGTLTITMSDTEGGNTSFSYVLNDNSDYQVLSIPFNPTDTYLGTINTVTFSTDSTAVITIDTVKASTTAELTNNDYVISKSVLETPIAKIYGVPLDIEYYVELL